MEGVSVAFVLICSIMFDYGEASIFSWNNWTRAATTCRNEEQMVRTRLHMDPDHRNKAYERYAMTEDISYETLTNVALNQPATMSSKYQNYGADLLTDGVTVTDMFFGSCAQTKMESSPWFRIDLEVSGYKSYVEEIIIYNRFDCCSSRANNINITIGDDPTGQNGVVCNVQPDMDVRLTRIICQKPSFGRYIHLRVPGPQILHLCEVQALGGRYKNVAFGKNVALSSADGGNPAAGLTDGDLNSRAETFGDESPWFRIDIGQVVKVYLVRVYMGRSEYHIENSLVSVSRGADTHTMTFCGVVSRTNKIGGKKESYIVKCTLKGRYVQINLVVTNGNYLSSSEVEVLGNL